MTINRTTLLDLPLPVTGTESGTWGDITNNGLSQYVDIAVAGMNALTSVDFTAGALTLSNSQGDSGGTNIAAGSAQYATIKVSSLSQNSTITAPASNRSYRIVNLDSTYNLTIKASGQTGITFLPGQTGVVAFTGTDYEVVGVVNAASSTDNAVPKFDGTTGQIIQNTGVTIDDSNNVSGVAQLNATTVAATTGNITTVNATTVDTTNIEVTNIKAKDGTAAGSIADSTGVVTLASSVLTTTDINGGTIDGTTIGGASAAVGTFTQVNVDNLRLDGNAITSTNTNGNIALTPNGVGEVDISKVDIDSGTIDGTAIGGSTPAAGSFTTLNTSGQVVFNDAGADVDFRVESDTVDHALFVEGSSGNVGVGNTNPSSYNAAADNLVIGSSGSNGITIVSGTSSAGYIMFADGTTGQQRFEGQITYDHTNNFMALNTSGSERMRIDSSGNVGIGTSSPTNLSGFTSFTLNAPGGANALIDIQKGGTISTRITGATGITDIATDVLSISTGSFSGGTISERMRITSGGNLLVGTTSGAEKFCVTTSANASTAFFLNNNGTAANQYGIVVKLNDDPNNTNHMVQCLGGATERAIIRANGGLANYSANNVNLSDRREKTNFAPAKNYLDTICAIPVQTFNYIDQNHEDDPGLTLGVVAQDVQKVAPELVMESNWAGRDKEPKMRLSIYQTDLQYALMKCIQELKAELDTVKAELATLKG